MLRFIRRLFGCPECALRERELSRLENTLRWTQDQLDRQNKRLAEIAEPRVLQRVAAAERPPRPTPVARPVSTKPLIPGFEPAEPLDIELEG